MLLVFVGAGGPGRQGLLSTAAAHARSPCPKQRRAVAAAQIVVLPAVEVPDAAALGPGEVQRMAQRLVDPRRRRDAARQRLASPLIMLGDTSHDGKTPSTATTSTATTSMRSRLTTEALSSQSGQDTGSTFTVFVSFVSFVVHDN